MQYDESLANWLIIKNIFCRKEPTMEYTFTYRKKNNGTQLILSYRDAHGKWRQKSKQGFKGTREAKRAEDALLEQVKEKVNLEAEDFTMQNITLRQLKDLWAEDNKNMVEYSTIITYNHAINAFSDIADMKITDITYADVMRSLNNLPQKTNTTKRIYLSKIKRLFKYAISPYKILKISPAADIIAPKDKRCKKIHALTQEELSSVLNDLKDPYYDAYVIASIAAYAGLRYGEILGLTWDSIDFTQKIITVSQQYNLVGDNKYGKKPTKSMNGYREIPIPHTLVSVLKEYHDSTPIPINKKVRRIFNQYKSARTGSINYRIHRKHPNITIHDLRHTYATQLLANGVDVRTVASLMGDTIKTVIETYVHYTDDMREKAQKDIDRIFA